MDIIFSRDAARTQFFVPECKKHELNYIILGIGPRVILVSTVATVCAPPSNWPSRVGDRGTLSGSVWTTAWFALSKWEPCFERKFLDENILPVISSLMSKVDGAILPSHRHVDSLLRRISEMRADENLVASIGDGLRLKVERKDAA